MGNNEVDARTKLPTLTTKTLTPNQKYKGMTTEENKIADLMKPRYKVIADYPGNNLYKVGSIIEDTGWGVELFPNIFKKLSWWEERDVKDMPEYVMFIKDYMDYKKGSVYKTNHWNKTPNHDMHASECYGIESPDGKLTAIPMYGQIEPSTEQSYLNQLNNK